MTDVQLALTRTRRRRRVAAVCVGLVLGVFTGEIWARMTHGAPLPERLPILRVQANELRGWEMVPGETHYTYLNPVRVNALGLRGAEVGERAPGEYRVLALGDSLVYGQGVADDQTLPAHLRQILTERLGRPVSVVNGGLRAYATHQELGLLRDLGDEVAPDLVLLFWYWNDVDERDVPATAARLAASGPIAFDIGDPPSGLPLLKWRIKQLLRGSALIMVVNDELRRFEDPYPWMETALAEVERLDGYLAQFQAECERLGARFAMVTIPPAAAVLNAHPADPVTARAIAIASARGIPTIALGDDLRELVKTTGELPLVPFDGHYDDAGNRALALETARFLATQEWFGQPD
ncbi:SGNH/GDSL hydrolase family protein [Engelhardtia mirabilis]|uniref:SGNH hydrolase-type esterase domain-containing protein n=1 Tax=Engelhardtia mirabilis TaxID=2528011 RepID=A0A518BFJ4_9BACT|nr:hypothetical protein Pla133_08020 [Planctomycetes bacterium Pla133]QDV00062.1 hypothetical protein Pla86_08010 [Planctomycetes bacterium Pla86]